MSKKEERKMKKSVWQYLIDHSRKNRDGTFQVSFLIKSDHDFWDRVRARERGYFKRKDIKEEKRILEDMKDLTKAFQRKHAKALDMFNKSDDIEDIKCQEILKPMIKYRNERISYFLNTINS